MQNLEAAVQQAADEFLGRWNRLVSTTNWEKGRIVAAWRQELIAADAPSAQYSDERWSQLVGNVSAQHVGRLRRVHTRFAAVAEQYPGLYWSHFQAALDWDDAEMWLEGAVQNNWSVAEMRQTRVAATGAAADALPADAAEVYDEDAGESDERLGADEGVEFGVRQAARPIDDDETEAGRTALAEADDEPPFDHDPDPCDAAPVRPFERIAELPPDLAEAFERFKLAILHHKLAGWEEIGRQQLLDVLDALKVLATS